MWAKALFLKDHLTNRERFNFFFFLTGNGMMPELASTLTASADAINGDLRLGIYDTTAVTQMFKQLPKQVREGSLFRGTKPMMDMILGYVVKM